MAKRVTAILESLVIAAILLVLVQTFLEDYSILADWPVLTRQRILLAGFFFDLFFTIEFLARLYYAILDRRVGRYLGRERGWIDFLASVPLLMFNSGPFAAGLLLGRSLVPALAGVLNLLKIVKAVRIARILRLMRIVKVLRRIRNLASPMAQRHVALVTAIGVSVLVFGLLLFTPLADLLGLRGIEVSLKQRQEMVMAYAEEASGSSPSFDQALKALRDSCPDLLVLRHKGETRLSRYDDAFYAARFAPGEYGYTRKGELEAFFDQRPLARQLAAESLVFLVLIVALVLAYLFFYGPHFALTVTDPIHVMRRGMEEAGYNLEVKVVERYREDDVFRLAEQYNEHYLPLKDRSLDRQAESLLSLEDAKLDEL